VVKKKKEEKEKRQQQREREITKAAKALNNSDLVPR